MVTIFMFKVLRGNYRKYETRKNGAPVDNDHLERHGIKKVLSDARIHIAPKEACVTTDVVFRLSALRLGAFSLRSIKSV